jgi:hypothetical protein
MTSDNNDDAELTMLPDDTVLRFKYYRTEYEGVEYHAQVRDGRIEFQGETWSPSGAAREVDTLIRGEGASTWNGWEKWEWNQGDGSWEPISNLTGND